MITTEKELREETGLSHDGLCDAGFNLDDWDVCFVSDTRLIRDMRDDSDGYEYVEPIDDAYWLVRRMEDYCVGYEETVYQEKYYYTVHHA